MRKYPLIITILLAIAASTSSCKKPNEQPKPQPTATTPTQPQPQPEALDFKMGGRLAGIPVHFYVNREKYKTISWDYGDGSPTLYTGPGMFSHVYSTGTYTVTMIVNDDTTAAVRKQLVIRPNYGFSVTGDVVTDDTLKFVSYIYPATTGDTYNWSFGDGATSTEQNPAHAYSSPGAYKVVLAVNGDKDYNSTKTINIEKDPLHTLRMCGSRVFRNAKTVTRPVETPVYTEYRGDTTLNFVYVDKLTMKLNYDVFIFNADRSSLDVVYFEKVFPGTRTIHGYEPGSLAYYVANDSFDFSNRTAGTVKGGTPGGVWDYTFTCSLKL